jgi:hypothetical protein
MKKSSTFSVFRKNEYQLRYFIVNLSNGTFKYTNDEFESKKNNKAVSFFASLTSSVSNQITAMAEKA